MVEDGLIGTIIAKDLSRFGRDLIPTPTAYFRSIGRKTRNSAPENPYLWSLKTLAHILSNRQYTGCAVNFKSTTVSYKVHKVIHNPVEEQQIIPDMQEPIISEEEFERVQELRSHKRRNTKTGRQSLFAGLLYCPDCGAKLHFCAAKSLKPNQEFYRCANYNSGRGTCKIHYIRNVVLEEIVLEAVSSLADYVRCYEPVSYTHLQRDVRSAYQTDDGNRRCHRSTLSSRPDGMGAPHEQHPKPRQKNRQFRTDLQLSRTRSSDCRLRPELRVCFRAK